MMEMLRNEVRYTTVQESIPGNLDLRYRHSSARRASSAPASTRRTASIAVTEYLGRTPWFYRMVDMVADAMNRAPVDSRFGKLPASDAELNGDYLQVLVRLGADDRRPALSRVGAAHRRRVHRRSRFPAATACPSGKWDFTAHTGERHLRLRDHGNELVVGLALQFALEH